MSLAGISNRVNEANPWLGSTTPEERRAIVAAIRARQALDELEEGEMNMLFKQVARSELGLLAKVRATPPRARTQELNLTLAADRVLLNYQYKMLDAVVEAQYLVEEAYYDQRAWQQAEAVMHSVEQTRMSELPPPMWEETPSASKVYGVGRLGENSHAALIAIAITSLLSVLLMPFFYNAVLRDPRQRPYKKKKKKAKPRRQPQQHHPSTRCKKTKKSKSRIPAKPKAFPQIRHKKKTRTTNGYEPSDVDETKSHKQQWMDRMYRVHTEASAQFQQIRQELNARNLARSLPKDKKTTANAERAAAAAACHPSLAGLGRKAGTSQYLVHVGAAEHLYKTSKPTTARRPTGRPRRARPVPHCVDLHGRTRAEALRELDDCLPRWLDEALEGAYPFVIPVRIVCGGGNQVLSEAVADWIRANGRVARAPKDLVL